jgi:hypothetical protein
MASMDNFTDKQIISCALSQWANYIETGEVHMSADTAKTIRNKNQINNLNLDQITFAARLRELSKKMLNSEFISVADDRLTLL